MSGLNIEFENKCKSIENEYDELEELLQSVEIVSDTKLYTFYKKRFDKISKIAMITKKYKNVCTQIEQNNNLLNKETDKSFVEEIKNDLKKLNIEKEDLIFNLKLELKNLEDSKEQKVNVEINYKSGDKENIFTLLDLFKNYSNLYIYAFSIEKQTEKNLVLRIEGDDAFDDLSIFNGNLKLLLLEKETIFGISVIQNSKMNYYLDERDIEIETLKSSGAGGQHINKTESAIRLVHKPTGISVVCQDERSQLKNKQRAFENLDIKIKDYYLKLEKKNIISQRDVIKNSLFSNTPTTILDFDKNVFFCYKTQQKYKLKDILEGKIKLVSRDIINGKED